MCKTKYTLIGLLTVILMAFAYAPVANAYIYWTESDPSSSTSAWSIARANADGTSVVHDFVSLGDFSPGGLAVEGSYAYVPGFDSATRTYVIARANLANGTVQRNFITLPTYGGAIVADGSHLYWQSGSTFCTIARANLDGSSVNTAFISDASNGCWAVAIGGSHIYWLDWAPQPSSDHTIARANEDGTSLQQGLIDTENTASDTSLAADDSHVYWSTPGSPGMLNIARANLDGSFVQAEFITAAANYDYGGPIVLDGSHIYWGEYDVATGTSSIARANLDGSSVQHNLISSPRMQGWLAADNGGPAPSPPPPSPPMAPPTPPPAPQPSPPSSSPPAAVIVPGLDSSVSEVDATTPGECTAASEPEPLHVYCDKLTELGQRVIVVPSKDSPHHAKVLDVHNGFVDGNAQALDQFVRYKIAYGNLDPKPLLVGYSMGGVIARVAVAYDGTPARGIVTLGAPHTGSYWADAYTDWMLITGTDPLNVGTSVWDLTEKARTADNKTLPAVNVPVYTVAGTAATIGDGVVGTKSACGKGARIGSDVRCTSVYDFHLPIGRKLPGGSPDFQTDPVDAAIVGDIAVGGPPPGKWIPQIASDGPERAAISAQLATRTAREASKARTFSLRFVVTTSTRRTHVSASQAPVFARQPFSVSCGSSRVATTLLIPGVYYLPREAFPCANALLTGKRQTIITASQSPGVHGKVVLARRNATITISARGLQRASVSIGKHSYGGHRRGQAITITVPRNLLAKNLGIASAVVAGHRVAGAIRIPS